MSKAPILRSGAASQAAAGTLPASGWRPVRPPQAEGLPHEEAEATVTAEELLGSGAGEPAPSLSIEDAQLRAVLEAVVYVADEPLSSRPVDPDPNRPLSRDVNRPLRRDASPPLDRDNVEYTGTRYGSTGPYSNVALTDMVRWGPIFAGFAAQRNRIACRECHGAYFKTG